MMTDKELKGVFNHLEINGYEGSLENFKEALQTVENRRMKIIKNATPFLMKMDYILEKTSKKNIDYINSIFDEVETAAANDLAMMMGTGSITPEPLIKILRNSTVFEYIGISDRTYHNSENGEVSVYKVFGAFENGKEVYFGGESINIQA